MPPYPDVDFFGRVEVLYNNTWGTVCDDVFRIQAAHVLCRALNFTRAICPLRESRYGPGVGTYACVLEYPLPFKYTVLGVKISVMCMLCASELGGPL